MFETTNETTTTIRTLARKYQAWAVEYYRKPSGRPTREHRNIEDALRVPLQLSASTSIDSLRPSWMRDVQQRMIADGLARSTINARCNRIRRVLKWAVSMELCSGHVLAAIAAVPPLKRGRTTARETPGVKPVEQADFDATVAVMREPARSMVQLLWLSGMRPGELVQMRPRDIEQGEHVWTFRPAEHKTEHHGQTRCVALGPRAQLILTPWLSGSDPYLFPELMQERHVFVTRSGAAWSVNELRQTVERACRRAGVARWCPLQLRHAAATRLRRVVGLDAARTVLGHSKASTTEIYAEADTERAMDAMRLLG
jgi:integrase